MESTIGGLTDKFAWYVQAGLGLIEAGLVVESWFGFSFPVSFDRILCADRFGSMGATWLLAQVTLPRLSCPKGIDLLTFSFPLGPLAIKVPKGFPLNFQVLCPSRLCTLPSSGSGIRGSPPKGPFSRFQVSF